MKKNQSAKKKKFPSFLQYAGFVFYLLSLSAALFWLREFAVGSETLKIKYAVLESLPKIFPNYQNDPWKDSFWDKGIRVFPAVQKEIQRVQPAIVGPEKSLLPEPFGMSPAVAPLPPPVTESYEMVHLAGFAWIFSDHGWKGIVGVEMSGQVTGARILSKPQSLFQKSEAEILENIRREAPEFFRAHRELWIHKAEGLTQ